MGKPASAWRFSKRDLPRQRTIHESLSDIEATLKKKPNKSRKLPPKDPKDFYFSRGSQEEARASQIEAALRQGEREQDD